MQLSAKHSIAFGVPFFISLILYMITASPYVQGGDSGELITAAFTFSVAHPPGYPLYTLIAKLFTLVPIGTIAWRVSLASAFASAATSGILSSCIYEWNTRCSKAAPADGIIYNRLSALPGIFAALLFSTNELIWHYSVLSEVFALNNLLIGMCFYFVLRNFAEPRLKWRRLFWLFSGLALANHHTSIFFILIFSFWIFRLNELFQIILFMGLGLTPYAYLYFAANTSNSLNWGETNTLRGFLIHLFRSEYGTFRLMKIGLGNPTSTLGQIFFFFREIFRQTFYIGSFFAIWSVFKNWKKNRSLVSLSILSFVFYLVSFHFFSNASLTTPLDQSILMRFWQPLLFLIFIWIGLGFCRFRNKLSTVILVTAVLTSVTLNFSKNNYRKRDYIERFAKALAAPLPENSLLLLTEDLGANTLHYLQACQGYRSDIKILELGLFHSPWYKKKFKLPDSIPELIQSLPMGYPIFIYKGFTTQDASQLAKDYQSIPLGIAHLVIRKDLASQVNRESIRQLGSTALVEYRLLDFKTPEDPWESAARQDARQVAY